MVHFEVILAPRQVQNVTILVVANVGPGRYRARIANN